jgi:hypothetical protein
MAVDRDDRRPDTLDIPEGSCRHGVPYNRQCHECEADVLMEIIPTSPDEALRIFRGLQLDGSLWGAFFIGWRAARGDLATGSVDRAAEP